MVLSAWKALQKKRRSDAARQELPIAQLVCLQANLNRDSTKQPKAFELKDFLMFAEGEQHRTPLPPEVAAVALSLSNEDRCPPLLKAAWSDVMASVTDGAKPPALRALRSDDDAVWLIAPKWEGRNIRAGLALVRGRVSGPTSLRDVDRPLNRYVVDLPSRSGFGWLEANLLLVSPET